MNNLLLTTVVAAPLALFLTWQVHQVGSIKSATAHARQQRADSEARLKQLQQTLSDLRQKLKTTDAETKTLLQSAPKPAAPLPLAEPTPEELVWDNGHDWIWLDKQMILSLGVSSFRRGMFSQTTEVEMESKMSKAGEELLTEFSRSVMNNSFALSEKEQELAEEDPASYLKGWATNRPPEVVAEVGAFLQKMAEAMKHQPVIAPDTFEADPTVATLLGLDPGQLASVQQAVSGMVDRIHALDRQHLEIVPAGAIPSGKDYPNQLSLRLSPFAAEGQQLVADIQSDLQNLLGNERAAYWMQMAASELDHELAGPGKVERKLTLRSNGREFEAEQYRSDHGTSTYSGNGVPYLESWWRPFIRKTKTGFEIVQ